VVIRARQALRAPQSIALTPYYAVCGDTLAETSTTETRGEVHGNRHSNARMPLASVTAFAREAAAQQAASPRAQKGCCVAVSEKGSKREAPTGRHSTARLVEDAPVAAPPCFWWRRGLC
jgi:hypothetical protein